jgi:predicted nuclease of predicted toxin-antitoxin system
MLRLLVNHDIDQDILRGLLRRVPDVDAVTAYEVGLDKAEDPELLAWAAESGRVLVTHDRRTMPAHAAHRLAAGDDIAHHNRVSPNTNPFGD